MPYCTHSPLAGAESAAEVERYAWPDPETPRGADDWEAKARARREGGARFTAVSMASIFHRVQYLLGFEKWLMDIKLNPALLEAVTERVFHINGTLLMRQLERVGEWTDIVSMADDFGTSRGPYMSLPDFRAVVKPYLKRLVAGIKSRFPHIRFYLHSHGQIMDLAPDLIDCGIDVLNPVLPLDHMDHVRLKREYGRELCFDGGIDIEHIVPFGTPDEIRAHVREVIDVLAPGGGYCLRLQDVSPVIPAGNIVTAYECAREFGGYA